MGTDIHCTAERRNADGKWEIIDIYVELNRNYGLFGWLADLRNYSAIPPLHPGRGMPADATHGSLDFHEDNHSATWYLIDELMSFDYNRTVEDRRVMVQTGPNSWNGGATAEPGGGEMTTYRDLFGFFRDKVAEMRAAGAERLIFSFDS